MRGQNARTAPGHGAELRSMPRHRHSDVQDDACDPMTRRIFPTPPCGTVPRFTTRRTCVSTPRVDRLSHPKPWTRSLPSISRPPRPAETALALSVSPPPAQVGSFSRGPTSSGHPSGSLRSLAFTAWVGRTYATRRPSPSCGRHSGLGSPTLPSSPPTTLRSTVASCTLAAPATDCGRPVRGSSAPCTLPARSGQSVRRNSPMFAGGSAFRSVTTMLGRTQWHALESFLRLKPLAGGLGGAEPAGQTPAPLFASDGLRSDRDGRTGNVRCPFGTLYRPGGGCYWTLCVTGAPVRWASSSSAAAGSRPHGSRSCRSVVTWPFP